MPKSVTTQKNDGHTHRQTTSQVWDKVTPISYSAKPRQHNNKYLITHILPAVALIVKCDCMYNLQPKIVTTRQTHPYRCSAK